MPMVLLSDITGNLTVSEGFMTITRCETDANLQELNRLADFLDTVKRKRFHMNYWIALVNPGTPTVVECLDRGKRIYDEEIFVTKDNIEDLPCETACCMAGWWSLMNGRRLNSAEEVFNGNYKGSVSEVASNELNLDREESDLLFYEENWPRKNGKKMFPKTPKGAANRIRYFIKTGK